MNYMKKIRGFDQKLYALDMEYRSLVSNEKQREFETKVDRQKNMYNTRLNLF